MNDYVYRGWPRKDWDDVEPSQDARLTAALQHLAYFLSRDEAGDAMIATLAEEISNSLLDGTPPDIAEGVESAMKDNLDAGYSGNPEACLSYLMATVAEMRRAEKGAKR